MESLLTPKETLREELKERRAAISHARREEAAEQLLAFVQALESQMRILSFSSFQTEIDTTAANRFLLSQNRLYLPKIEGEELQLFHVTDAALLSLHPLGILEPIPALCKQVDPDEIDLVLIPALGFDRENNRIGYGKGYYDRLLPNLKRGVGIGFREQFLFTLPTEKHDISLQEVVLF